MPEGVTAFRPLLTDLLFLKPLCEIDSTGNDWHLMSLMNQPEKLIPISDSDLWTSFRSLAFVFYPDYYRHLRRILNTYQDNNFHQNGWPSDERGRCQVLSSMESWWCYAIAPPTWKHAHSAPGRPENRLYSTFWSPWQWKPARLLPWWLRKCEL